MLYTLTGCGGETPPADDGIAELGTGTTQFEPVVEGQDLPLIAGPQGGHHFILYPRMMGLSPGDPQMTAGDGNPQTTMSVFDEDGAQIDLMSPPYQLGYREGDDGFFELASGRIVQVVEARVASLDGQPVRLTLRIVDADGLVATDEVTVTAVITAEQP